MKMSDLFKRIIPVLILFSIIGCKTDDAETADGGPDAGDSDTQDTDDTDDTDSNATNDTDSDSSTETDTDDIDAGTDAGAGDNIGWVQLDAGTYQMGSPVLPNEKPVHEVSVPRFRIMKNEVTVTQYAKCVSNLGCSTPSTFFENCNWNETNYEGHPVNCITWDQSVSYCAFIGARLPSESEWEYAARSGGQNFTYPWGNNVADCDKAVMENDAGVDGCNTGRTFQTCSKSAGNTQSGICDMAGNVWEWTQDIYQETYTGAPADGSAWEGTGETRVIRGGGLLGTANGLTTTVRNNLDPLYKNIDLGFRCAK